jgi:hypothetical protein
LKQHHDLLTRLGHVHKGIALLVYQQVWVCSTCD